MIWYFSLENSIGQITPIENPLGWDKTVFILSRDPDKHGVMFSYQASPYTYDGLAYRLLKDEYEANGIEGVMYLRISVDCYGSIRALPRMKFVFAQYSDNKGSTCSVTIPVEAQDDLMLLRNRIDQKVNLFSTTSFGGVSLSTYSALPFVKTLPSKGILVTDNSNNTADLQEAYFGESFTESGAPPGYMGRQVAFSVPGFTNIIASEIGGYFHPNDAQQIADVNMVGGFAAWEPPPSGYVYLPYWVNDGVNSWDHVFPFEQIPPIVNYDVSLGFTYGPITVTLEGHYKKNFAPVDVFGVPSSGIERMAVYIGILKGYSDPTDASSWNWLSPGTPSGSSGDWNTYPYGTGLTNLPVGADFTFSFTVTLEPGDRIYYFDKVAYRKKTAYTAYNALYITNEEDSYFKVSGLSVAADSTARLFMINEAFSRVAESVTDDRLRVYSEFYGRTDSQPYSVASDGCGAHLAITKGLLIRKMEDTMSSSNWLFSVSMKDLFEGINPIHNIGMGIESDPVRPGYNRLRIEDWAYFYDPTVMFTCDDVDDIKRDVKANGHITIFKFGYAKWEAEQYNGIDEFLTGREFRTELTQANNTFTQVSNMIASGYAIEVTRRLGNITTEDWRYDNDTFVITMKRSGGDLIVQVGDIASPSNILDPDTVYNFRIRPSAMAMAWLPKILASYRNATTSSKIIFTDGSGNLIAEGELSAGNCIIEGEVITENQDISPDNMNTPTDGMPITLPELVTFDYPISVPEFFDMVANPYKMIAYNNDHTNGEGWIDRIEFKMNDDIANFNLIPSR